MPQPRKLAVLDEIGVDPGGDHVFAILKIDEVQVERYAHMNC